MVAKVTPKITKSESWYDRAIRVLIYSLAVVIPLVFCPWFYAVFSAPKLLALRLITLAILFLWGLQTFHEKKFSYRQSKLNWFLLACALVAILTTITSTHLASSLLGAETRFLGIFTVLNLLLLPFFVFNFIQKKEQVEIFMIVMVITASVLAAYGIIQYFGLFQEGFQWSQNPSERVFGTMSHSNHFGAYLGMSLLLSVGMLAFLKTKIGHNKKLYWPLLLGIFLQAATLVLTGSRGAFFATIIATIMIFVTILIHVQEPLKKFFQKKLIPILAVILALIVSIIIFAEPISKIPLIQRFSSTIGLIAHGNTPDRISWWQSSISMIKDRPLLGFGLGTYRDIYNNYRRTDYLVPGPGDLQDQVTPESSHMEYLDIAVTEGLIGLIAFVALIIFCLWFLDKTLFVVTKDPEQYYLTLAVKGGISVFLLQAFLNFGVIETLTIFYLLIGVAASLCLTQSPPKIFPLKNFANYSLTLMVMVGVIIGTFFSWEAASAEISYKNALTAAADGHLDAASAAFKQTIITEPAMYEYSQAFGDFALQTGFKTDLDSETQLKFLNIAIQNYQQTIKINQSHPSTFYNLAMAELQLFQKTKTDRWLEQGISALKTAMVLSPNNPLYAYQTGKNFLNIGRKDLAREAFELVVKIRPDYADTLKIIANL